MRRLVGTLLVALASAAPVAAEQADGGAPIPYAVLEPAGEAAGYRGWTHVKSMLIHDPKHPLFGAFGGLHHVYANPVATKTLTSGGTKFDDGAVLVFDLLEAPSEGGATTEGARKLRAVMVKNAKAYAATGGWGYQAFKGDGTEPIVKDAQKECFACHQARAANDYVFSEYRQ